MWVNEPVNQEDGYIALRWTDDKHAFVAASSRTSRGERGFFYPAEVGRSLNESDEPSVFDALFWRV